MTKSETIALIGANQTSAYLAAYKGAWLTATSYGIGDLVINGGNTYRCGIAHTSGASLDVSKFDVVALGGQPADGTITRAKLDLILSDIANTLNIDSLGNLNFVDQFGFIAMQLLTTGSLVVNDLQLKNQTSPFVFNAISASTLNNIAFVDNQKYALVLTDANGWIGYAVNLDGSVLTGSVQKVFGMLYDIAHYMTYGQSLSIGVYGGMVTTVADPHVLTFTKGPIMSLYDADATRYNGFVNEVESTQESPAGSMGRSVKQFVQADGVSLDTYLYDILVSAPGQGATDIAGLSKGSSPYQRLLDGITAATALSTAQNKTYGVPGLFWLQGEANIQAGTGRAAYKIALLQLYSDLNTDIKAITGQKNDLAFVSYQVASHNPQSRYPDVALAQLETALNNSNIYLGPVMYPYAYSDQVHLGGGSEYAKAGALAGYILKRIAVDGVAWKPIHLKSWTVVSTRLDMVFNVPALPLVLDTATVTDPGNYGFRLFNAAGTEQTISSVAIIQPNTVRVICAATIGSGWKLTYAINGTALKSGKTEGSRGCLRDSQGLMNTYTGSGLTAFPLHNWTPIFEQYI